jgi:hypothetical protein
VNCLLNKARRKDVRKEANDTSNYAGARISVDTTIPFPRTLGGNYYWVKFCDCYSGMSWNTFIKHRGQVFESVKQKLYHLKGQGYRIKYLRLDSAGEHHHIKDLCLRLGINPEFTAPHTPQHNGK